jgi:hypothetical protein
LPQWNQILFLGLGIAGMVTLSIFTSSGFHTYNLAVIWPLPHLIIGLALSGIMHPGFMARQRIAIMRGPLGWLMVVLAIAINVTTVRTYYSEMLRIGSSMKNSLAIYALANYINQQGDGKHLVFMDWGIGRSVYALTTTRWNGNEAWLRFLYATEYDPSWDDIFTNTDNWYVFRVPRYSMVKEWLGRDGPRYVFDLAKKEKQLKEEKVITIHQPNGDPFYEIYTLIPCGTVPAH